MSDTGSRDAQKRGAAGGFHYVVAERPGAHVIIMEVDAETPDAAEGKARHLLNKIGLKSKGSDRVDGGIVFDGFVSSDDTGPQVIGCLPVRPLDPESLQDSVPHATLRLDQEDAAVLQAALTILLQQRREHASEHQDRIVGLLGQLERPSIPEMDSAPMGAVEAAITP